MKSTFGIALSAFVVAVSLLLGAYTAAFAGGLYAARVVDANTGKPIHHAMVTVYGQVLRTDENGLFQIIGADVQVGIRAYGYQRRFIAFDSAPTQQLDIDLTPVTPRALYLSVYGIGEPILRDPVVELIDNSALNSLVIDIKGDRGIIPYKTSIKTAQEIGADTPVLVANLPDLVANLRARGIYTIARIVVFKDNILAQARPDLALKSSDGTVWRDREGLAWTSPYSTEVWDYNIAVAVEAAKMGFDEIQFDYLRFPDEAGPQYMTPNTEANRVASITGFLQQARQQLLPYNVFLSADLFGYVCWNKNDTYVGQRLEDLVPLLDYISPMLYPSSFQYGIPGYALPVDHPYEIVFYTLRRAAQRTGIPALRFRPWLQAFRDYAFDRRDFTAEEIRGQIDAAETFGSNGWMLWNPGNVYSRYLLREDTLNRHENAVSPSNPK